MPEANAAAVHSVNVRVFRSFLSGRFKTYHYPIPAGSGPVVASIKAIVRYIAAPDFDRGIKWAITSDARFGEQTETIPMAIRVEFDDEDARTTTPLLHG